MPSEVTQSQRDVMQRAAKIGNASMRAELNDPRSPIRACFLEVDSWKDSWSPLVADWNAKSGFGLRVRELDVVILSTHEAFVRVGEIVGNAMYEAMTDRPQVWVGPMLRDLFSADSFYEEFLS